MRKSKRYRLLYGRMAQKHLIYFARQDLLTTTIDDLLQSTRNEDILIVINISVISGPEPAVHKGPVISGWIISVAECYVRPANHNLSSFAWWEEGAIGVYNGYLCPDCHAHRASFVFSGRKWIAGYLVRCLCHTIRLDHRNRKRSF